MAPKSLTSRPLDLLYVVFFVVHLVATLTIDLLPLWPTSFQNLPVLKLVYQGLKSVVEDYTSKSNDPFMLVTWDLVQRDWEFYYLKIFMWMELVIQLPAFVVGTYGLRKNTPLVYPFILCYATAALVTTTVVLLVTLKAPSAHDTSLDPVSKFYAMTDEGRWTILGPLIPFLVIPAIMWVDMFARVTNLVSAGVRSQKASVPARKANGKKEL